MKLRGSLTESTLRELLLKSWAAIKKNEGNILKVLEGKFGKIESAFILSWTPEQHEDLYIVLVAGKYVVSFEVSKNNLELVDYSCVGVNDYQRKALSRSSRIQLAVALDLSTERLL